MVIKTYSDLVLQGAARVRVGSIANSNKVWFCLVRPFLVGLAGVSERIKLFGVLTSPAEIDKMERIYEKV